MKPARQVFKTTLIESLLSMKIYFNMPNGKGEYVRIYPAFDACDGDTVRVTIEHLVPKNRKQRRGKK